MKGALVVYLTLISLVPFVRCYGKVSETLEKFLQAQSLKRSDHYVSEEASVHEYLPVYVGPQEGLKATNKIIAWPGQPNGVNFDQYSGYVTVDPEAGRALFYYFAESENSSSKPLVLWLNGGPGCSSLGGGAMTEQGPFRVNRDGKTLWRNEYSWNEVGNVLFLESPAGVGFSYSNSSSGYNTGDRQTAKDSYTFLVNWLERFPEYKTQDFYISGESYAGHYVPQLAQLILRNNKITNQTVINLKGIAIGNAYMDMETQRKGRFDYYWTHSLISDEIYHGLVSNCFPSSNGRVSDDCQTYYNEEAEAIGNIDRYNIYAPLCSSTSNTPWISGYDPCADNYVFSYLNNPEVQKSLHANATGIPGPWSVCSNEVYDAWIDSPVTVLPTIKELMASGISIWLYSGDTDSIVPVTTTRYAINKLGISVKTPWYPWYTQGEVGGYVVEYENLTFVTVRGAGHLVPSYQPARGLALISSFLEGKLPPSS